MTRASSRVSRAVSFIGAGIVLATFVVKDVMQERLKDIDTSLTSAEMFSVNQAPVLFIQSDLIDLKGEVGNLALTSDQKALTQGAQQQKKMAISFQATEGLAAILAQYVGYVELPIKKIQSEKDQVKEADGFISQCSQLRSRAELLEKNIDSLYANPHDPALTQKIAVLSEEISAVASAQNTLKSDAAKVTKDIFDHLRQSEDKAEKEYSWASYTSYVLFPLGWLVGLYGQLMNGGDGQTE